MTAGSIFTTSTFTKEAKFFAEPIKAQISLIDFDELQKLITEFKNTTC